MMKTKYDRTIIWCAAALAGVVSASAQPAEHTVTRTAFLKDCAVVAPAISPHFYNLCKSMAREKTRAELTDDDQALKDIAEDLKKWGPDVAKRVIAKCAAAATNKAVSPLDLAWCLDTKGLDVEGIAKGSGDPGKISKLVGKTPADNSPGGPGWNSLSEDQKSEMRAAAVHACAAEAPPYVAAACAAVAAHEDFLTSKPYGPNGEIAKQFDTLMHGFTAAGSPQDKANEFAQKALQGIGISVPTPADAAAAATNVVQHTADAAKNAHEKAKDEIQKRTGIDVSKIL